MEPVSRRQFFKHAGSAAAIAVVAGGAISPLGLAGAGASTLSAARAATKRCPLKHTSNSRRTKASSRT